MKAIIPDDQFPNITRMARAAKLDDVKPSGPSFTFVFRPEVVKDLAGAALAIALDVALGQIATRMRR